MNIERLIAILRETAQAEIMPRFRKLEAGQVRTKRDAHDLVTDADVAAERAITDAILSTSALGTVVIGEEAASADPRLLDAGFEDETVIYLDPVDGTANFAAGLPLFAVMAAVVRRGEVVSGVIYDPVGDDWMMAERGCGAWQVFADGRMARQTFAPSVPVARMSGTVSLVRIHGDERVGLLSDLARVKTLSAYRCAGHEYRMAAGGHLDFVMYDTVMPWDHGAGTLLVREAGGHVGLLDGSAYSTAVRSGNLLAASDPDSWEELRRTVFSG